MWPVVLFLVAVLIASYFLLKNFMADEDGRYNKVKYYKKTKYQNKKF